MKKRITATVLTLICCSSMVYGAKPITIELNGKEVKTEVAPFVKDERTFVPIRFISEALGYGVQWDNATRMVTVTSDNSKVQMTLDKKEVLVDGKAKSIDVAPFIEKERTFVPLRFVAENLNVDVKWNDADRKVLLTKEDKLANLSQEEKAYVQEFQLHQNAIFKSMGELKGYFFEHASKFSKDELAANYDRLKADIDTQYNSIKNMKTPAKFDTAHKLAVDAGQYLSDMLPKLKSAILDANENAAKDMVNLLTQYQIKMTEVQQALDAAKEGRPYTPQKEIQQYNDEKKKQDSTDNLLQDKNIQNLLHRI